MCGASRGVLIVGLRLPHRLECAFLFSRVFHRLLVSGQTCRPARRADGAAPRRRHDLLCDAGDHPRRAARLCAFLQPWQLSREAARNLQIVGRSEEHTSELQSLMRISYAVFCLKKKTSVNSNTIKEDQHDKA